MFESRPPWARAFSVAIYLYEPGDGGLDRVAILLANHLQRRGIPVELWMARLDGPAAHLIDTAVTVRRVPAPGGLRRLSMIAQFPALAAMVRRHRPDVLYSAGNQSNMLVALAALGTRTRTVGRISNPILHPCRSGVAGWARLTRFRTIARLSDLTIVMGDHDRGLLAAGGRVRLLPRPTVTLAMEQVAAMRVPRQPEDTWRLLMVGRLVEQKDQATALAALALLRRQDWRLTIAGQGPMRTDLEQRCIDLGIADRVDFIGYVDDPDRLVTLMGQADLLLQPSRWEGLCATLIEAMACGAGVVATDSTPNIGPLLSAGYQHPAVPVVDPAAFARAIQWAMDNPAPSAALAMATRLHGVNRALDLYLRAFAELVGAHAPHPFPSPVPS